MSGSVETPIPYSEPVLSYAPGTPERAELKSRLAELASRTGDIPLLLGDEEVRPDATATAVAPHDHDHELAVWHQAGPDEVRRAVRAAAEVHGEWASWRWQDRAAVFLRAADLLSGPWRATINAATMLGQSKTAHQAEIDAACELADFLRFNVRFAQAIYEDQPLSPPGMWNRADYRPLEGFVYAVTPFNFTSIAGNLPTAPAIMGNTVLWKPSSGALPSAWEIMRLLREAGLPPGVVNFVPGRPARVTEAVLTDPGFAGIHYTGSTEVFQSLWKEIGHRIASYRSYPRLVGETGGKDFIVAHPSADAEALVTAIVRGGFEYQGQKCSAASRVYVPEGLWEEVRDPLVELTEGIAVGDPTDFRNFMGAVIHEEAFRKITGYIDRAKESEDAEILAGGGSDASTGYFIRPTLIRALRPDYESMVEEIFGPVVTIYVYPDGEWRQTLELVDRTSPYGLTGAVFAGDRRAVQEADAALRFAAGNFYVNDKPTGAVVGQQPFGGARASGTNDKAGSLLNLVRWISARSIKETFVPDRDYRYPFMEAE